MVKLSEVLEQYIIYFPERAIEVVKNTALAVLRDPKLQPEQADISETSVSHLIAIKNTTRGVLWQIEEYEKERKYKVGELLDLVDVSSVWSGDDFEECWEYINQARK